jgi:putative glutamine amidotransferase
MTARLRIGVSSCFLHADSTRALFKGKTLLYAEESMLSWIMSAGVLPVLLPRAVPPLSPRELLEDVDALVLQGGADVSPLHYGEEPLRPEWAGDHARDLYEMELVRLAIELDRPVLGCCRGAQVLNVALGGSLWQDVETMHPERRVHRDWHVYDQLFHEVQLAEDSWLARCYAGDRQAPARRGRINSVHHQAIKQLGKGLAVEARSTEDGVVEAIRLVSLGRDGGGRAPFALGVQWHPEFLHKPTVYEPDALDPAALLRGFLEEVVLRRAARLSGASPATTQLGAQP